ncbi:MAG TPA: ribose 5-phosphate isomerase B [Caldisericia bacterium]|nr:ribose 5-phosphate isomerase B [Caldisericia bacterium]
MKCKKIVLGSDHGGFELKQELACFLKENGHLIVDVGSYSTMSTDYPDIALLLCSQILTEQDSIGILICGSGIGMSISANKIHGIRAALCSEPLSARLSREHNNANVLCLGARMIGSSMAKEIVHQFLEADFSGDRHLRRIQKITMIEEKNYVK